MPTGMVLSQQCREV